MRNHRAAILACLPLLLLAGAAARAGDPVLLVHEGREESDVPAWKVRSLLAGETRFWKNGDRVAVWLPPEQDDPTAEQVYAFLHVSARELRRTWVEKVFKGEALALPVRPKDAAELIDALRADPGALGVLPSGALSSGAPKGLKVLTVDGKRAGDEGYALASGS